ncbi:NUDIX domain-containing protein [Candidatus Thiothrix sp. Deng01]|uniref:NUDIX domain-containing protein n=1 Tax=Candidatus Thiothrix phosphatis TaxID=3112415 RepID=A0ABU6CUV0_9GAMM|nr:NUDIX domain-containing protein [Candidatus Thiothrix sp. Deng01]MEB4589848.1 NUDIX domain-containing protein [Candidatus Thiothrix sp. Deng01]
MMQTDEQAFLQHYDKTAYDTPLVTVDPVLFTYHEGQLNVLLVQRSGHPDRQMWGLPGGFVDLQRDATLEDTALRKLREKTGVEPPYLEQLHTFGNATRDKRSWSVTVCYTALIAHQECAAHIATVTDVRWVSMAQLATLPLAFDHGMIIEHARARLRQKALYSIVPAYALPEKFTLPELQQLHEALLGKPLQKKSFRRRIEQAELLIDTGEKRMDSGGRPAALYRMGKESGAYTFVRNLEA